MQLILGSQSPRRKEILGYFTLPFAQKSSDFDEDSHPYRGNPAHYAMELSQAKADVLTRTYPDAAILTADTVVVLDKKLFGKPLSKEEAFLFLKELSGKWHSVFTGITLNYQGKSWNLVEETRVLLNPLTDAEIHQYHHLLDTSDKAGAYFIQQAGGLIVRQIDGCYYNVMGLPINAVRKVLLEIGIDLWEHLR